MNYSAISRRFWAVFFDNCIIGGIFIGLALLLKMSGISIFPIEEIASGDMSGMSRFYLLYGIVFLAYEVGFLSSSLSATPGKIIMEIEVACANASFLKVILRSLIKLISTMTGLSIIFYTIAFFNEKKQALHDLIAGSFVIDREAANSAMDLTKDQAKKEALFEEMKSRGMKTFSEQKALEEEMYGKAKKSPINTILSGSFIWIVILVISFAVNFFGSKALLSDLVKEVNTIPQFRDNGGMTK